MRAKESHLSLENRVSLFGIGLIFLSDPLTNVLFRPNTHSVAQNARAGFLAPLLMLMLVGSVIGLAQLLRSSAHRAALIGAAMTITGFAAGIRIMGMHQIKAMEPEAVRHMFHAAPILWSSIVPTGILFPLGLITLGVTLFVTRVVPRPIASTLIVGAILFPVGRIGGLQWAIVSCDVILGGAFALLGREAAITAR
jgi:hypothetical protein